jgi:hypothetical protein
VDGLPLRHVGMALRKRGRPSAPTQALIAVIEDVVSANLSSERHLYKAGA